jgi:nicotinamidase-related amidase
MLLDFSKAAEIYAKQQIGATAGIGDRPALLVVDFVYGFTDPESPIGSDMSSAVEATQSLLPVARKAGVPIVYTIHGYRPDMADAGVWPRKYPSLSVLQMGTRWTEIDARVEPRPEDLVIVKQYPSAFFGTTLHSTLVAGGIDSLIVTGTTTSGCIRGTVVDGMQHGYRVFVPEECVADRDEAPHRANLFDMGTKYADVGTLETVVEHLEQLVATAVAI